MQWLYIVMFGDIKCSCCVEKKGKKMAGGGGGGGIFPAKTVIKQIQFVMN